MFKVIVHVCSLSDSGRAEIIIKHLPAAVSDEELLEACGAGAKKVIRPRPFGGRRPKGSFFPISLSLMM